MIPYRDRLPQLGGQIFLTDGGLETTLVFLEGVELPLFAAFPLLETDVGRAQLQRYFAPYLDIARKHGVGMIADTATWRANADWGAKLGYNADQLAEINRRAVAEAAALRELASDVTIVVNGVIGPRGDGYSADTQMSAAAAELYHFAQIEVFAQSSADMVSAITMTYPEEAIGVARAAKRAGMPCAISFTVETDGRLPSGTDLGAAIERTDREASGAAAYYMINCAHPAHFCDALPPGAAWLDRIRGVRANASTMSHAELDNATRLDSGDPDDLSRHYIELRRRLKNLNVLGGCCGTDHRHVGAIVAACLAV
jgi:homocysteine S-methyltransferase